MLQLYYGVYVQLSLCQVIGQMGTYPSITFTMQAVVNGVSYLGSGRNQKIAKANAAEKALRALSKWTDDDEKLKAEREKGA